jgi:glycerol-3-phosphate dehydrogenase
LIHLVHSYGSSYPSILNYATKEPSLIETIATESPVLKAEIIHAVRQEMAQKLVDVVCRRTPLGAVGPPEQNDLLACASLVAAELGWDQKKCQQEIASVGSHYALTRPKLQKVE